MAISRKTALQRLRSSSERIEEHLDKIVKSPGHSAASHWRGEMRNWLAIMEKMVTHVGTKTAAEWLPLIQAYKDTLEKEVG